MLFINTRSVKVNTPINWTQLKELFVFKRILENDQVIVGLDMSAGEKTIDVSEIFEDDTINAVFIGTRHAAHARQVIRALDTNKHVFVEKPLAMNLAELKDIYKVCQKHTSQKLMVGFNRRFSPFAVKLKEKLQDRSDPLSIMITVNAGAIPGNVGRSMTYA